MNIDHGMNIAEVKSLASAIERAAARLQAVEGELNYLVQTSRWVGPHSVEFKTQWWPEHRRHLRLIRSELLDFGHSAKRNAAEQAAASRADAGHAGAPSGADFREALEQISSALFGLNQVGVLHDLIKGLRSGALLNQLVSKIEMAGPVASAFTAVCLGVDILRFVEAAKSGNIDAEIRRSIDIAFDAVGLVVPAVFLGKGVWDATWVVGTAVYNAVDAKVDFSGNFIDSVVRNQYGGNLKNGVDLAHRYDGVGGFLTYLGDGFSNVWKGWK